MRVEYLPEPPNNASTTVNTRPGVQMMSPEPRSGRTFMMLKLVGTAISRRKSLYFCNLIALRETSGLFLIRLKIPSRMLRAKRSWLARS